MSQIKQKLKLALVLALFIVIQVNARAQVNGLHHISPSEQSLNSLHHPHHIYEQQQLQQQQHNYQLEQNSNSISYELNNNSIPISSSNSNHSSGNNHPVAKKSHALAQQQSLNKLQKYLTLGQQDLVKKNPGSLLALARALKMAIVECQYQMHDEPWDCPIYGFSMKPVDVFGRLMSRSFKETSFIHSLLSSAIAHSIARACTESMIITCGRRQTHDGYSEDIEFGKEFAQKFMEAGQDQFTQAHNFAHNTNNNNIIIDKQNNLNNNIVVTGSGGNAIISGADQTSPNLLQTQLAATSGGPAWETNVRRERKLRSTIYAHNAEVGRLHVLNGMRRECKCHGLSGACNIQTCWLKLPPFREVASKLHDSLDQAIKVAYSYTNPTKQKSLTSTSAKVKRRPVARSIGESISPVERIINPSKFDLLYLEESPDFCVNNERYNIKGTKGRTCSESQNAINSCERLCCGRGYKTEVREEKHKCECQFKFCCELDCKTCTGRKIIHKCL